MPLNSPALAPRKTQIELQGEPAMIGGLMSALTVGQLEMVFAESQAEISRRMAEAREEMAKLEESQAEIARWRVFLPNAGVQLDDIRSGILKRRLVAAIEKATKGLEEAQGTGTGTMAPADPVEPSTPVDEIPPTIDPATAEPVIDDGNGWVEPPGPEPPAEEPGIDLSIGPSTDEARASGVAGMGSGKKKKS